MKSICGVYCRNSNISLSILKKIQEESDRGIIDSYNLMTGEAIVLGQVGKLMPGEMHDNHQSLSSTSGGLIFLATGRIDNLAELYELLNIPATERVTIPDHDVMLRAYTEWGRDCSRRMFGDWVFAAWHPRERQLVVSRSHYGCIAIYYHIDQNVFAFSTSRQTLLALQLVPLELDELWLAQYITSWHAYFGERTPHKPIKSLPPAHYAVVTSDTFSIDCYWRPENNAELHLSSRHEYAEAFRSIFEEAVRCRLRSDTPVAATLSGGLDSGSVSAMAARILATTGQRLKAFTSVPLFETEKYLQNSRFGNEFEFARATADHAGNIDLIPLGSAGISPIMGIRHDLDARYIPVHGAVNLYWMNDIRQAALEAGCGVLLTGAAGNGAFSWRGYPSSQSWSFQVSHFGWQMIATNISRRSRQLLKSMLPDSVLLSLQRHRMDETGWYRHSAINPGFARRIGLIEQRLADSLEYPVRGPRGEQLQTLMPGRMVLGTYNAEKAAAQGLEVRDPTCDARLVDFVFSVPDRVFMDPESGIDRWLVREAMKGILPDEVRLNHRRGRQAADIIPRLRGCTAEVEDALNELAGGTAAEFVDVDHLRQIWGRAQSQDSNEIFIDTSNNLMRGIMAGLFVNGFHAGSQ